MSTRVKPSLGCGYFLVGVMVVAGAAALSGSWRHWQGAGTREWGTVLGLGGVGLGLWWAAVAYARLARRLVREAEEEERWRRDDPAAPWRWRRAWRGPAIAARDGRSLGLIWLLALGWNAVSLPAAGQVLTRAPKDKGAYLVLVFPLIGLALLAAALRQTMRWRKFGRARFVPAALPGAIGAYLGGVIEVPACVLPEGAARVRLRCVRITVTGQGKHASVNESIVWEREERLAPERWTTQAGRTEIPVLFHIPAGMPASDDANRENRVEWRLSAEAAVPGVDFATSFEVPVFVTGETASVPEAGRPVLPEYELRVEAVELPRCGVRPVPDGFIIDSDHLRGARWVPTLILLSLAGVLVTFWGRGVPGVFWVVTGVFAAIFAVIVLDVWNDRFVLRLEPERVVVVKRRWWGRTETRCARADVVAVAHEKSMGSGTAEYFRLRLVGRAGVEADGPAAGATFAARKLRYQLRRAVRAAGEGRAASGPGEAELRARLARTPRFEVVFAKHIPGRAAAEAVGKLVLAAIQGTAR